MTTASPPKTINEESSGAGEIFLHTSPAFYRTTFMNEDDVAWQTLDADDDLLRQSQSDEVTADVLRDLAALGEQTSAGESLIVGTTSLPKREREDDGNSSKRPAKQPMTALEARGAMNEAVSRQTIARKTFESARTELNCSQELFDKAEKDLHQVEQAVSETSQQLCDKLLEEDSSWNTSYNLLLKFREKHGHTRVPRNPSSEQKEADPDLSKLAGWVGRQRSNYRRPLEDDRRPEEYQVVALKRIGFDFDPHQTVWMKQYNEIKRFKSLHGHFDIPSKKSRSKSGSENSNTSAHSISSTTSDDSKPGDYSSLSSWAKRQQYQYKLYQDGNPASEMTEKRIALLEDIGFPWKKRARQWMERYSALKDFKEKTGHTQLPNNQDFKSLSDWTKDQRRQLKKHDEDPNTSTLSEEQVALLKELPLNVDPRASSWSTRLQELLEFRRQHGHSILPTKYPLNQKLSSWVSTQRRQYALLMDGKPSQLTEERIKRLTDTGFEWKVSKKRREETSRTFVKTWDELHAEMVDRKLETGTLNDGNDPGLRSWLHTQKAQFQLFEAGFVSQLTADQVSKLKALGIDESDTSEASTGDEGECKPRALPTTTMTHAAQAAAPIFTSAFELPRVKTWEEWYAELLTHHLAHHSFLVPTENPLHRWIEEQRFEYDKYANGHPSALTNDQINKLNFVGFPWSENGRSLPSNLPKSWEEMFTELLAFRIRYQSFDVPIHQGELYTWVETQQMLFQRQAHTVEKSDLAESRIRKLQEIGFPAMDI